MSPVGWAIAYEHWENNVEHPASPLELPISTMKPQPSKFLLDLMLRQSWCPRRLSNMWPASSSSLYYLYHMESLNILTEDHTYCTRDACCIDNFQGYEVQHSAVCDQSSCHLVHTPIDSVIAAYDDDIPVLACTPGSSDEIDIKIIPGSKCPGYIAISHVWSDGLGNDQENAVPLCQIVRLAKQVKVVQAILQGTTSPDSSHSSSDTGSTAYFWLDSMCIPVAKEHKIVRTQAISRIDTTFEAADAVLSLDGGLQKLSARNMDGAELAAHLFAAKWPTRCWTLPEQQLAYGFFVQFKDCILSASDLNNRMGNSLQSRYTQERLRQIVFSGGNIRTSPSEIALALLEHGQASLVRRASDSDAVLSQSTAFATEATNPTVSSNSLFPIMRMNVILELMSRYAHSVSDPTFTQQSGVLTSFQPYNSPYNPDQSILVNHWNAIARRSTTKIHDATGIFGMLMNIAIGDVMRLPAESRMKAVLKTQTQLPSSFLFSAAEKMHGEPRNKWLPAKLTFNINPADYMLDTFYEGLMVGPITCRENIYRFPAPDGHDSFQLHVEGGKRFDVQIDGYQDRPSIDMDWCLIFPPSFQADGITQTISCAAACCTVRRRRGARWLMRWECLADVKCVMLSESPGKVVEGSKLVAEDNLYVECGSSLTNLLLESLLT